MLCFLAAMILIATSAGGTAEERLSQEKLDAAHNTILQIFYDAYQDIPWEIRERYAIASCRPKLPLSSDIYIVRMLYDGVESSNCELELSFEMIGATGEVIKKEEWTEEKRETIIRYNAGISAKEAFAAAKDAYKKDFENLKSEYHDSYIMYLNEYGEEELAPDLMVPQGMYEAWMGAFVVSLYHPHDLEWGVKSCWYVAQVDGKTGKASAVNDYILRMGPAVPFHIHPDTVMRELRYQMERQKKK